MAGSINPKEPYSEYFRGREEEQEQFRRVLSSKEGTTIPIVAFHGIAGSGKTWLLNRFRDIARASSVPCVVVNLDPQWNPSRGIDRAAICSDILQKSAIPAPRTSLALIHLLQKEYGFISEFKNLLHETTSQGIQAVLEAIQQEMKVPNFAGLAVALIKTFKGAIERQKDPLFQYLNTPHGRLDSDWLLRQEDTTSIRRTLFDRLAQDLHASPPHLRAGLAVHVLLLVDSTEHASLSGANEAERIQSISWITDLMASGIETVRGCETLRILVVPFGQTRLTWPPTWSRRVHGQILEGLSPEQVRSYSQDRGILSEIEILQVLEESCESNAPVKHHALSVGLSVDTMLRGNTTPLSEERIRNGETRIDLLVERFYSTVTDEDARRIRRLTVTPSWDKMAVAWTYRIENDPDLLEVKWNSLNAFSFVQKLSDDDFTIHQVMRRVTQSIIPSDVRKALDNDWRDYWRARTIDLVDMAGRNYWWHAFKTDSETMRNEWSTAAKNTREEGRMTLHAGLVLAASSVVTESDAPPSLLVTWGDESTDVSIGDHDDNHRQAIWAYRKALKSYSKIEHPVEWANTQLSIGDTLCALLTGNRASNIDDALSNFKLALDVFGKDTYPAQWASVQNSIGNAYESMPLGNPRDNRVKAIAYYKASLSVTDGSELTIERAMTMHNLANVLRDMPGGAGDNIEAAIKLYVDASPAFQRADMPTKWATLQINHGLAIQNRTSGSRSENINTAIRMYKAALEEFTFEHYPLKWANTLSCLGCAYIELSDIENKAHLEGAITAFKAALTVFNQTDHPSDWATANLNLGVAFSKSPNNNRYENSLDVLAHYRLASKVFTEKDFPQVWAGIQNNIGIELRRHPSDDSDVTTLEAISAFQNSLRIKEGTNPREWAGTQNNLGLAFMDLRQGNRSRNISKALDAFKLSLSVYTYENDPWIHCIVLYNLANAAKSSGDIKTSRRLADLAIERSQAIGHRAIHSRCLKLLSDLE